MASAGTLLSDLDSKPPTMSKDDDLVNKILADMNIPSQANPIMNAPPPSGNGRVINSPNPNSVYPVAIDPGTATAHMIGKDFPTSADFAQLMHSPQFAHGGSQFAPVQQPVMQQQPTLIETAKGNMYSDIISQIKQPLLVAIIVFIVSLPIINVLIGHYFPSLLRIGGDLTTAGLACKVPCGWLPLLVYSEGAGTINGCIILQTSFRGMKFNSLTYNISLVILVITALYTLIYSGLTGLLLCSSVTLIAAAFMEQFELITAVAVIFSLFYIYYLKGFLRKFEPFQNQDNAQTILNRVNKMKDSYHEVPQNLQDPRMEPAGVYDPAVEGFQDVQPNMPKEGESSESKAAPAKRMNEVNPVEVEKVTSAVKNEKDVAQTEFESATNNLFKVGKMPSENMDGPKLDSGSTLLKAMESFKPEQINAMTGDTKQLLETQKALMGMLNQMRPVLADGKELLQTFSGMFGGGGAFKL